MERSAGKFDDNLRLFSFFFQIHFRQRKSIYRWNLNTVFIDQTPQERNGSTQSASLGCFTNRERTSIDFELTTKIYKKIHSQFWRFSLHHLETPFQRLTSEHYSSTMSCCKFCIARKLSEIYLFVRKKLK